MKKYLHLSISELHELLIKKEITPLDLVKEAIASIKADDNNAVETLMENEALEMAKNLGEPTDEPLWGIPFAVKDNISTKGVETTGSSDMLLGYIPLFDATVVKKLKEKGAIPVVKTTLDELAMGGTGTTGHKGITYNPWDKSHTRMIGGSSCGSAALSATGCVPFALGSDTGDSVRKPASLAGLVGFKPSWGRISRFGLFPFATSMDHIGYFTRNVFDSAIILNALAGRDDLDATSSFNEVKDYTLDLNKGVKGVKIAVISEVIDSFKDEDVKNKFNETLNGLKEKGAVIDYVHMDINLLKAIYPTYMVISCAEATSNNANLDGIKFGPRVEGTSWDAVMRNSRTKGFSELIKRRFIIGSYALLKDNQEEMFLRAQKARNLIVKKINEIFNDYDAIYLPAAPSIAPKFDDTSDRLSDEYLIADNHLAIANFGGFPSITLPIGMKLNMPFGANITTKPFTEELTLRIASALEEVTGLKDLTSGGER